MSFIEFNEERCKRDGFCVRECPMKIIAMPDRESFPRLVSRAEELCIDCGHCIAVCPHDAITLKGLAPEDCEPVKKDLLPTGEQIAHFMKTRRSVRDFKSEPVPKELIEKCIDIARYAPSGHNFQPVHWLVIHDTDEAKRLAGIVADWMRMVIESMPAMAEMMHLELVVKEWDRGVDKILRGAQHIVIAHGDRTNMTAQGACTIALAHLELAACSLGVGATWGGFVHAATAVFPPMQQAIALPDGHQSFGAMLMGWNNMKYRRIPPRKDARITWC